ncbi:hypothetical protein [Paractinoplanes rishiriensis]|uniref:Uncharacterized protein n=1 Tax=Paractinoplanes rishiriensis TaxID=1050105 RepID=A0A919K5E6_9ACTN|nr:hypothetical protein [Actinoplanes rishiriensis]GIF00484.1 hypothetical protein Ari01nite_79480 [Actinoplanes rishiriensis]
MAVAEPEWFGRFVLWLRVGAVLRTASVVAALEGARARVAAGLPGSRAVVGAALQRADEPGEAVAYWLGRYGRRMPKPVKRGIADAAVRLYHERSLLKYDADGLPVRFGDVLDLTHPVARDARQGDLFRHALDRRHGRDHRAPESLAVLTARAALMALPVERRAEVTDRAVLAAAGMTWEALAGWRQRSRVLPVARPGESVLAAVRRCREGGWFFGNGTLTEQAVRDNYAGHDRVVLLTDEQAHLHGRADVTAAVPADVPAYTWNLAGYRVGHTPPGRSEMYLSAPRRALLNDEPGEERTSWRSTSAIRTRARSTTSRAPSTSPGASTSTPSRPVRRKPRHTPCG